MTTNTQHRSSSSLSRRFGFDMLRLLFRYRYILLSVTKVELLKRYSGSVLGKAWVVMYPVLLLLVYLFVFSVIFKIRLPGYSDFEYVLYVFCGLVPFIGVSEALTAGCPSIRQNMHLVKNVMLPIELIPVRTILVSMTSQLVGTGLVIVLLVLSGNLSWHVVWLPLILFLQLLFLIGVVLILSALAVALPDIGYFVNLAVMFLMFISPIGFKPEMVPAHLDFIIYLNPLYYMTDVYRASLMTNHVVSAANIGIFVIQSFVMFLLGSAFFRRFKNVLVDYE